MLQRFILLIYGITLTLLFAIIFTAQVLGFIGLYQPILVLPLTGLVWLGAGYAYFRLDNGWLRRSFPAEINLITAAEAGTPRRNAGQILTWSIAGGALLLLIVVFVQRMALYPYSNLGSNIAADAMSYHLVKGVELYRTGTMWDLSILYGEYPIGYESLIALGVMLTRTMYPIGIAHALNTVFLSLTVVLLLRRYTRLPLEWLLLGSVSLFFYPDLYSQLLVIGKNDLFLSAALLAALLHSPLNRRNSDTSAHVYGLAFCTVIATCVKANGAVIPGLLWLLTLYYWWQAYRAQSPAPYLKWRDFGIALLLMLPAVFWLIRNIGIMGRLFSPEVSSFFGGSILANLGDMRLYTSGADSTALIVLTLWLVILVALVFISRRFTPALPLLLLILWGLFVITPLGAFHTTEKTMLHIEWRYTTHTFLLMAVVCIVLLENIFTRLLRRAEAYPRLMAAGVALGCLGVLLVLNPVRLMSINPDHTLRWQDPYAGAVGTQGYRSGYDYVKREIRDSTIIYNGGLAFYLYDADFTNTIRSTEQFPLGMPDLLPRRMPDYFVYFNPRNELFGSLQPRFQRYEDVAFELVYEDEYAEVYRRR
jgi:hypothetical protein